jgi:ubiquinone/menaquinone biosynthesis C-methylase UbiE
VLHSDLVGLLREGIDSKGGKWADLGAGEGAFTAALADLLGPGAHITAADRDSGSLRTLAAEMGRRFPATRLVVLVADFSRPIALTDLDGIVMANSLHFIRDKRPVLARVKTMIRPGGRLIVVEYGSDRGNPWVPHPFSFSKWAMMAAETGFERTRQIGTVPSRYLSSIYSAISYVPAGSSVAQVS